ncbi:citrate lyase beta subunit [bacterium]|nr:citrate lyase beta subunit [bacterium]
MNTREFKCVKILTDLIENEGLIGIKTSFEDEGALFNETIRLKEICNQAKTKITLKIGGPEAIRDIKDSLVLGVKGLVAPMVESSFGVKKFIQATKNNVPEDVLSSLQLNVNVETINGVKNINEIIQLQEVESLYGITVGRVDLVSSMNKDRSYVNSDDVLALVKSVFSKVKERGLKACLGGAISVDSLNFLKSLQSDGLLDKFETRYAIFDPAVTLKNLSRALAKAQMFEYEWLMCKHEMYASMADQDTKRIKMIQDRLNQSINY